MLAPMVGVDSRLLLILASMVGVESRLLVRKTRLDYWVQTAAHKIFGQDC